MFVIPLSKFTYLRLLCAGSPETIPKYAVLCRLSSLLKPLLRAKLLDDYKIDCLGK